MDLMRLLCKRDSLKNVFMYSKITWVIDNRN